MLSPQSPEHLSKRTAHKLLSALTLSIIGLSATPLVWADAEIVAPENVIILAIDGQDTGNTGFFSSRHTTYTLPAGAHTITARYDRLFELANSDEHDVVRSKGVSITATLSDQQEYTLGWQPEPQTHEEALNFIKQPTLIITATNGTVIASQKGAAEPTRSFFSNLIHGNNPLVTTHEVQQVPAPQQITPQEVSPPQQLQQSWSQATPEQKKQFRLWIDQQTTDK